MRCIFTEHSCLMRVIWHISFHPHPFNVQSLGQGHGIDSMADCTLGMQAMKEAVGEAHVRCLADVTCQPSALLNRVNKRGALRKRADRNCFSGLIDSHFQEIGNFKAIACLEQQIRWCVAQGLSQW